MVAARAVRADQGVPIVITTTKDGRTIRTGKSYTEFRRALYVEQGGKCARCRRICRLEVPLTWDYAFHVHHKNGRGLGGGKRDDTFEACEGLYGACHRKEHRQ